jgi:hypothetical protein
MISLQRISDVPAYSSPNTPPRPKKVLTNPQPLPQLWAALSDLQRQRLFQALTHLIAQQLATPPVPKEASHEPS